jgi:serine/threonine-protein kinase
VALIGPRTGTELAGYRVESVLGRGGMGVVYLAEDVRLHRKVALKVITPELADHPRFRDRFLRESQQAASIDHPNIIPVYDAGEADGALYMAMRYVEGTDLATLIRERGRLGPAEAIAIVQQVADALDRAHEHGLIHRDVKPGNVLTAGGSARTAGMHVYLCDFGLSKSGGSMRGLTSTGHLLGTVDYLAPEVIQGAAADGRADLYSLACLLFECLSGSRPFPRDNEIATLWAHVQTPPPSLPVGLPDVSPKLDEVVQRGLAKAPGDRQATCGQLAREAAEAIRPPEVVAAPLRPRRRSGRLLLASAAFAAVAIAAAATWLASRPGNGGAQPTVPRVAPPKIAANGVAEFDSNGKLVAMLEIGGTPTQVISGGGAVWAADAATPHLVRIDPVNGTTRSIPLPGIATAITFGGGRVWAFLGESHLVVAIDPGSGTAGAPIPIKLCCSGPGAIAADRRHVWVAVEDTTTRLDIATGRSSAAVGDTGSAAIIAVPGADGKTVLWSTDGWQTFFRRDEDATRTDQFAVRHGGILGRPGAIIAYKGLVWFVVPALSEVRRRPLTDDRFRPALQHIASPTAIAAGAGYVWVLSSYTGTVTRIDPDGLGRKSVATLPVHANGIAVSHGRIWVTTQPALASDAGTARLAYSIAGAIKVGETMIAERGSASPSWSPDAHKIAFARNGGIWTMAVNGSAAHAITGSIGASTPAWSPDGRWIAFAATQDGDSDIYTVHPDGSGLHAVTANSARDLAPQWSPDQATIVYVSDAAKPGPSPDHGRERHGRRRYLPTAREPRHGGGADLVARRHGGRLLERRPGIGDLPASAARPQDDEAGQPSRSAARPVQGLDELVARRPHDRDRRPWQALHRLRRRQRNGRRLRPARRFRRGLPAEHRALTPAPPVHTDHSPN